MFLADETVETVALTQSSLCASGLPAGYSDDDEDEPRSRAFNTPVPEITPDGPEAPEATSPSDYAEGDGGEETLTESAGEETAKDRGLGTEVRLGFAWVLWCSICSSCQNWGFPTL